VKRNLPISQDEISIPPPNKLNQDSEPAPHSILAGLVSVQNQEHNESTPITGNHSKTNADLHLNNTPIPHNMPNTRVNLIQSPCTLPFPELKASLGIHAEVYTASQAHSVPLSPHITTSVSHVTDSFISLLTYNNIPPPRTYDG
jgi:hypothetical protein